MTLAETYLAHSFFGLEGPLGIALEIATFLLLILHIAALVLVSERSMPLGRKLGWAAFIVFVPVVGATVYLSLDPHLRRRTTPRTAER